MKHIHALILLTLLGLSCAAQMTGAECTSMCKASGNDVKLFETAVGAVRCECVDPTQP